MREASDVAGAIPRDQADLCRIIEKGVRHRKSQPCGRIRPLTDDQPYPHAYPDPIHSACVGSTWAFPRDLTRARPRDHLKGESTHVINTIVILSIQDMNSDGRRHLKRCALMDIIRGLRNGGFFNPHEHRRPVPKRRTTYLSRVL